MITHIHAHRVYQYTLIAFCAVLAALFVGVALTRADDHLGVGTELVSTIEDAAVETKTESTDDGAVVVSEGALIPPPVPAPLLPETDDASTDDVSGDVVDVSLLPDSDSVEESEAAQETSEEPVSVEETFSLEITTDKTDYEPGETVTLFGRFFAPVKQFFVRVFGNTEVGDHWSDTTHEVTSDEVGSFSLTQVLDNFYRPFYDVSVSDDEGNVVAAGQFLDSANASANLDQAENGGVGDPVVDPVGWVNGNVNHTKGHYQEGDSIPYRMVLTGLPEGQSTLVIGFDVKQSSKFAIDYITSNDRINETVSPCDGTGVCTDGDLTPDDEYTLPAPNYTGTLGAITSATVVNSFNSLLAPQVMKAWGGTIDSVEYTQQANISLAASEAQVTIKVTPASGQDSVVLSWGGHISSSGDYPGLSAITLPGSPYHTRLIEINGKGGNQDRALAASAVAPDEVDGSITIVKEVVGADADFSFTGDITATLGDGESRSLIVPPGTYTVTEAVHAAYALTSLTCNDSDSTVNLNTRTATFVVAEGEAVVCTFTNSELPTLTLTKTVTNDNGGTKQANDFQAKIDTTNVPWAVAQTLTPGAYTASETNLPGYTASAWSGTGCGADGSVTLAYSDHVTCSITNNDQPGTLIVHKVTVPALDQTVFSVTTSGGTVLNGSIKDVSTSADATFSVNAGTYSVSEASVAGWKETGNTCDGVVVGVGETKECTITNTRLAKITIVKDAVYDQAQDFTFTNDFGNGNPTTFALDDDANATLPDTRTFEVLPGTYAVSEAAVAGWQQESATCTDGSPVSAIAVAPGEEVTCTFVNEEYATIVLVKNTVGGDGTFNFIMTGDMLPASASLTTTSGTASETFTNIDQDNTYSIVETVPEGWDLTSAVCSGSNAPDAITPDAGETVTCTFTNTKRGMIEIEKQTLPGDVETEFNFSGAFESVNTVLKDDEDLSREVVPGTYTATELVEAGWTLASIVCTDGNSSGNTTTGVATYNVEAGETVRCVFTNVKDPRIDIEGTAVNEVGDPHVFTVTVSQDLNGAVVPVADGTKPTVTITPNTVTVVEDTCADEGTVDGVCTVTINSDTAGIFTAHASAEITIGGVAYTIETDGEGENGADAVKTYVDGKISIDPLDAVNNVGEPHEFTVTVSGDDGEGYDPVEGALVTFTMPMNTASAVFVGGTDTCTTNTSGQCTVTITTDTPGNVTMHAETTFVVEGEEMTRSTDGTHGSSEAATKQYVAGEIVVKKVTVGGDGSFEFDTNFGDNFTLKDGEEQSSGYLSLAHVYSVEEVSLPEGWDMTSAVCDNGDAPNAITLSEDGDVVTCTFTNTARGKIIVDKVTDPAGDDTVFSFDPSWTDSFTLADEDAPVTSAYLTPGMYSVGEIDVPEGWNMTSAVCSDGSAPDAIDLDPGETVTCTFTNTKSLEVTKTAEAAYTRTWNWIIDKSVDDDALELFDGASDTVTYTVAVDKTGYTDTDWVVTGEITIVNPADTTATITDISDSLSDAGAVTVDCGLDFELPYDLAGGETLTCTYTKSLEGAVDQTNTVTVETEGTVGGGTDTADVEFGEPTTVVNASINVDDTNGSEWPFGDDGSVMYDKTFTCDADEGEHDNTATIRETGASDSVTVTVDCYALEVSKTAETSFTRTYAWDIEKTGDQTAVTLAPDQVQTVNYEVAVENTGAIDSAWTIGGEITITNPAPIPATITSVADTLSGYGPVTVTCPQALPFLLAQGESRTCTYSVLVPDATPRSNDVSVLVDGSDIEFIASANAIFADTPTTEIDECIAVTDDKAGALGEVCVDDELPKTFTYAQDISYGSASCGLTEQYVNTATLTTNDTGATDASSWTVNASIVCACTLTQGYWKTHSEYGKAPYDDNWANLSDGADTVFYLSGMTWYKVFWTPVKGNPYYQLAHQYMAAKLNVLNGAQVPPQVASALTSAENLFALNTPKQVEKLKGAAKSQWTMLAGVLGSYNEGKIGPGHCTEVSSY